MSGLLSLSSLFDDKLFRIPDYQRGYAWNDKQLCEFWDDLYNLSDNKYHYTGMLSLKILKEDDTKKWDEAEKWLISTNLKPCHVVDGQQRLTSCVILITSILEIANKNHIEYFNGISISEISEKYIVKYKKPLNQVKAYKFGYECDNPSFKYLRYKIMGEKYSGSIEESFYTLNLQNAKNFFDAKLAILFNEKGADVIVSIYLKLVNKLQFNIHEIEDDFDVFVAFETMNNRGKRLSNLEILKNRLIYLSTIYKDDILPQLEKNELRKNINNTWREVYCQLGRNKEKPLDDDEYLRNHWTLFYKYTRNKGDDYIKFLLDEQFNPKTIYGDKVEQMFAEFDNVAEAQVKLYDTQDVLVPKEIFDYVNSLKEVSKYWYLSYNPDQAIDFSEEERKWITKLNHIGIGYFRTLIIASMMNVKASSEERILLYKTIEKFIFLCFRLAQYNSNYDSVNSYKYARLLYMNEIDIKEVISFFESEFTTNIAEGLNSFKANIGRTFVNYDGFYSWYPLKYFLFEYEAKLSEGRNIAKLNDWTSFTRSDKDKISVEHIFPQKPSAYYWRNNFRKYQDSKEQHILANSLGNLLALSQSVNSSLQNYDFNIKKATNSERNGYANGSYSEMEVSLYDDWNPLNIYDRGIKLLDFMEDRWGFKFPNEQFKKDILNLNFLFDGRDEVKEIEDADYTVRDTHFKEEKSELKVSEYLQGKDIYLVNYYISFFEQLKEKIPSLYEVATKNYIALRCNEFSKHLADIHLQNSKHKIYILTKEPFEIEEKLGNKLPDNYSWSLNYQIFLNEDEDFTQVINELTSTYNEMLNELHSNDNIDEDVLSY